MKSYDIFLAIFIIVVFIICNIVCVFISIMSDIKKNWPLYRCNPMIMPFAGYFGHDPMVNFTVCISEMQRGMMSFFTNPLDLQMFGMLSTFSSMRDTLNSFREFGALLRNGFGLSFMNLFGVFGDLAVYFQKLLISLKSAVFRILATCLVLINIGESFEKTGRSFINGPIYGALRVFSLGQIE